MATVLLLLPGFASAQTMTETGKDWKIKVNTNSIYDTNLVAAPKDGSLTPTGISKVDTTGFQFTGSASYNLNISKDFKANVLYDVDKFVYSAISGYDLTSHMLGGGIVYKLMPLLQLQMDYKYFYNNISGTDFSGIHFINPSLNYMNATFGMTRFDLQYKDTNNWVNDTRDGRTYTTGLSQYFFFDDYKRRISVGYKYSKDEMEGLAFSRNLNDFQATAHTPVIYGVNFDARAKFSLRQYDNFRVTSITNREDVQQFYTASFTKTFIQKWGFMENLNGYARFEHLFNNSNLGVRSYISDRYLVGLTASF
jgi:hypothetical protein